MEKNQLQKALYKQIEALIEKAEKAQIVWAESCAHLEDYISVYEDETGAPLPAELSSRVALLGYKRKRKRAKQ